MMARTGILALSVVLISSCATDPVPYDDTVINNERFVWAAGDSTVYESTSVDLQKKTLDTLAYELRRRYKLSDTTIEEWTNQYPRGYWGRTIAHRFETKSSNWKVQGFYPTSTGETWNRIDSMIKTNESGESLAVVYLQIRTENADTVINTSAGSFRCAKYLHEWITSGGEPVEYSFREHVWYAPRVGMVQWETWYTPFGSSEQIRIYESRIIQIVR